MHDRWKKCRRLLYGAFRREGSKPSFRYNGTCYRCLFHDRFLTGFRTSHSKASDVWFHPKVWLGPTRFERSGGLWPRERRRIEQCVTDHHEQLMDSWNDF